MNVKKSLIYRFLLENIIYIFLMNELTLAIIHKICNVQTNMHGAFFFDNRRYGLLFAGMLVPIVLRTVLNMFHRLSSMYDV